MSDRHDFDAWHVDGNPDSVDRGFDGPLRDDELAEVDAREHDLWGFGAEGAPSRRGSTQREADGHAVQREARTRWLAPVFVIVFAVAAFGAAWMVTRGMFGTSSATSQPSIATSSSTAPGESNSSTESATTDSPTSNPSTESSSSSPSSSSTISSSSSSDTSTAAAPAGAVSTCGDGQLIGDAGVKLAAGSHSSCAYVATAAAQVRDHVAHDDAATSFSISPYSEALHRIVPLACTRADHLTECSGGRGVHFWVAG